VYLPCLLIINPSFYDYHLFNTMWFLLDDVKSTPTTRPSGKCMHVLGSGYFRGLSIIVAVRSLSPLSQFLIIFLQSCGYLCMNAEGGARPLTKILIELIEGQACFRVVVSMQRPGVYLLALLNYSAFCHHESIELEGLHFMCDWYCSVRF
jgi:hypothetical protein